MSDIIIDGAPKRLEQEYSVIFTKDSLKFIQELITEFDCKIDKILLKREERKLNINNGNWTPKFLNPLSSDFEWKIDPIPVRLKNRKIDLGDVSPGNTINFIDSLYANVQGVQVDFDDGHCPTWRNTIQGIYNVRQVIHRKLPGAPIEIEKIPILMLRPRAFNMIEHHCMVNGKVVSAPLFDFALIMFHIGKQMSELHIGPYFYLSKIEDSIESELWNEIFIWTQRKLNIKCGTIKVCVLIENILAVYCMDDILYSLREHIIGLNCGIWDYSASIIAKFGNRIEYLIPDRNKYVNLSKTFLSSYMKLLINTCHSRGALATGGMAAKILPPGKGTDQQSLTIIDSVKYAKEIEIKMGVDGFLLYDLRMVDSIQDMWQKLCPTENQMHIINNVNDIHPNTLLDIPKGGVTMDGLRQNITIALLFIYHWLSGNGIFYFNGAVEDSATAEISRSQLWQWIRFSPQIEDKPTELITYKLVYKTLDGIINELKKTLCISIGDRKRLISSKYLLLELITSRNYVDYITSFLNDNHKFRTLHNKSEGLEAKL